MKQAFNKILDKGAKLKGSSISNLLTLAEIYSMVMLALFTALAIIYRGSLDNAIYWIAYNVLISIVIYCVAKIDGLSVLGKYFRLFRRLYTVLIVFFIYSQAQVYIRIVNPELYDEYLIRWDYSIFGIHPTYFFGKFSNPYLTEYLQFAYFTFFFMPVSLGLELYLSKRDREFDNLVGIIVFSFFFSYLMYFFMPAIGPRFTLHNYHAIGIEMPGLFLTDFFRNFVDSGGGIPPGIASPELFVNRDCMPSGHTWITLVNIYIAYKYKAKTRTVYLVLGFSLIISTIYLRYHYVVDVFAGIFFAVITLLIEPKIHSFYVKLKNKTKRIKK